MKNRNLLGCVLALITTPTVLHPITASADEWTGNGTSLNWNDIGNWDTGTTPTSSSYVYFSDIFYSNAYTNAAGVVNNIVDANSAAGGIVFNAQSFALTNHHYTTLIPSGITLTLGGLGSSSPALAIGDVPGQWLSAGNFTNYTTFTGQGSLLVNDADGIISVGQRNRATLDLGGLNTFAGTFKQLMVGATTDNPNASAIAGALLLAKTNTLTTTPNLIAPGIIVGSFNLANNTGVLSLGGTNEINTDGLVVGGRRSVAGTMLNFAPAYSGTATAGNLKLRGSAGGNSRVSTFSIGDMAAQPGDYQGSPAGSSTGVADFSGGTVDILADSLYVGRSAADTGAGGSFNYGFGTLIVEKGTLDVNNLYIAYKQGTNFSSSLNGASGTLPNPVTLKGNAQLIVNGDITMAFRNNGTNGSQTPAGALFVNDSATASIGGDITTPTNGISFLQLGGGTVTLSGGNVTNTTLAGFGTLTGANNIHVYSNLVIGGTGSPGTLNLGGNLTLGPSVSPVFDLGSSATIGGGINDYINLTGDLNLNNNPLSFTFNGPLLAGSTYHLIEFTGNRSGAATFNNATRSPIGLDQTTPGHLDLVVTNWTPATLTWVGSATIFPSNSVWNATDTNWSNGGSPDRYYQMDHVVFDDSVLSTNIYLNGALFPASVAINNSSKQIWFTNRSTAGPYFGSINGNCTITKNGTGLFVLGNASNNFTGNLVINQGVVRPFDMTFTTPGNNNVLGSTNATSVVQINPGGTFDYNNIGSISGGKRFVIQGSGFNGMGAITNSGTALGTMNGYLITLAGDTTVAAQNGGWGIRGIGSAGPFYSGELNLQGYTLTKLGTARFAVQDVMATDAGSINFGGGHFQIQNSVITGAGSLNFSNNTWVQFNYAAGATSYVAKAISTFGNFGILTPASGNQVGEVLVGSTITLGGPLAITNNQTLILAGPISGAASLTKYGNSNLVLNAANNYGGQTLVTAGTLSLGTSGSINNSPLVTINPGARLDVTAKPGGLTIASGQTLMMNGAATGNLTVGAGSTLLGAGAVTGSLTLASGGEIAIVDTNVTGTTTVTGNLNLNGGHLTWELAPSFEISDAIVVDGNLNLSGINAFTVNSIGGFDPSGTNTLITYTGTLTGGLPNLSLNSAARFMVEFVDPALTPGKIQIRLVTPSPLLTWKGGQAGSPRNWDTKVTANWDNAGLPDVFWSSDLVRFDDNANTNVVNLVGTLGPGSVAMENSTVSYFFGGSGGLVSSSLTNTSGSLTLSNTANNFFTGVGLVLDGGTVTFAQPVHASLTANLNGSGTFVKAGNSNLTLTGNAANYSGSMFVNAGTLRAGSSNVLGTGSATVATGATLDVNGQLIHSSAAINVAGTGTDGFGAINNRGAARTNAVANVTLTGHTTFGALSNAWGIVNSLSGGGFTLTKTNSQDVWIMSGGDTDLGDVDVRQGRLVFSGSGTTLGRAANTATVRSGAVLAFATTNTMPQSGLPPAPFFGGDKPITLQNNATLEAIGFSVNQTSVNSHNGAVSIATNGHFRVGRNTQLVLNGPISGNSHLILTNDGTLFLNGTNTYASNSIVYSGTLVLSNAAALPGTSSILVSNLISTFGTPSLVFQDSPAFPATNVLHVSTRNTAAGVGGDGIWNGPIFLYGSNSFSFSGGETLLDLAGTLITTNAGGTVTFHGSKTRVAGSLVLNGSGTAVTIGVGDGLGAGFDERFTTVKLDGSNYWTSTTMDRGRIILGRHNALPPAAPIRVGTLSAGVADRRVFFDLAGYNQTISSLTETAVGDSMVMIGNNSETADSTLTYAGTGTNTWGVRIVDYLDLPTTTHKTGLNVTAGILNLGREQSYTGPTIISGGTLNLIIGTGLLAGNVGNITESEVTVTGTGTLGGNGIVGGPVTVSANGTLSPGMSIGKLTLENLLTLNGGRVLCEVNLAAGTNDQIVGISTLTLGGTLVMTNIGSQPYTNGTVIKVFDAASYIAGSVIVSPAVPGVGMAWDISGLAVDGTIKVITVPTPSGVTVMPDGNVSFTLNASAGQSYSVHATTDITLPLASWQLLTNGIAPAASWQFIDLTATNHPMRFYRTSTP